MGRALSRATPPLEAGAWLEGFLAGSGLALIHDAALLALLDAWLADAAEDAFTTVAADPAPHVRDASPNRSAGRSASASAVDPPGAPTPNAAAVADDLDAERAALVLPVLARSWRSSA